MSGQVILNISESVKNLNGYVKTGFIHGYFGKTKSSAEKKYHTFVNSLINAEYKTPLDEVAGSAILGKRRFYK